MSGLDGLVGLCGGVGLRGFFGNRGLKGKEVKYVWKRLCYGSIGYFV